MKKRKVKTHTFKNGRYKIRHINQPILGVCDMPDENDNLEMMIPDGNTFECFRTVLHEAMHASGIPDKYLHDKDGCCDIKQLAKFIWREGWRKS